MHQTTFTVTVEHRFQPGDMVRPVNPTTSEQRFYGQQVTITGVSLHRDGEGRYAYLRPNGFTAQDSVSYVDSHFELVPS